MSEGCIDSPVDWGNWEAEIHATLMFVITGDQILLIKKLRGIGEGKVNGPGGKIDPGETPLECAIRETQEELGVTPLRTRRVGELYFDMTHIPNIHCHVFTAEDIEGTPISTDEAIPLWTKIDEVPYEKMWEDDRHWLPQVIDGRTFEGRFQFEDEEIQWRQVEFDVKVRDELDQKH